MSDWGVSSEVGRLQWVLTHRPGQEHRWILPWNKDALLFDDVLDIEEARGEHTGFTTTLTQHEVKEVLFVTDLLHDICDDREHREEIYREIAGAEMEEGALAALTGSPGFHPGHLIMGYPEGFPVHGSKADILLDPVPNLYFTRDPAFAVPGAVVIASPAKGPRRREARLIRSLLRHHPKFNGFKAHDGILEAAENAEPGEQAPWIEGGDVHVVDAKTVLVGIGERTNERGAEMLIDYLFRETTVERVIKVRIPAKREFMHLDTLMTFVARKQILTLPHLWDDPERFAYVFGKMYARYPPPNKETPSKTGEESSNGIAFHSGVEVVVKGKVGGEPERYTYDNVLDGLHDEEVIDKARTVYVAGNKEIHPTKEDHIIAALREQWNDAANVLALKPGQVICYGRNDRTGRALEDAGLEVVPFRGGELVRGRGGARCMTMPLRRDAV